MHARRTAALAAAVGTCLVSPAMAQTFTTGLLPSPDLTVAPLYPASVPNNAQPIPSVQGITGFGRTFGYGSSSTNTRRALPGVTTGPGAFTELNSNGHAIYIELFSPLVGASNGRGLAFPPATNFADGGSTSVTALLGSPVGCTLNVNCTLQPQIVQFQTTYGSYQPGDIAVQWSGINDFSTARNLQTTSAMQAIVNQDVTNQTEMVRENLALGARTYVFVGLADLGTFGSFTIGTGNNPALLTQGSALTNQGMLANLVALHQSTGANIHYFPSGMLVDEIRANPALYGFSAAGVQPNVSCVANAPCTSLTFAQQNQFLSLDGIHWTYRYHDLQAQAIANQLVAPFTVGTQVALAEGTARGFSESLLGRLDAYRFQNGLRVQPLPPGAPPFQVYVMGNYLGLDHDPVRGSTDLHSDAGTVTAGLDYRINPNLVVGAAYNYSNPGSSRDQWFGAKTDLTSNQIAAYGTFNYPNFFVDGVIGYGFNSYSVTRPGVIDALSASPDGGAFFTEAKGGYLFDTALFQIGPIASLAYAHTHVDAYTESGDPLLAQSVSGQHYNQLTGALGLQARKAVGFGPVLVNGFANLTANHDFLGGTRHVTTAQIYAPLLTIDTPIGPQGARTYGVFQAGASTELGNGFTAMLTGETSFGRSPGNFASVSVALGYRF